MALGQNNDEKFCKITNIYLLKQNYFMRIDELRHILRMANLHEKGLLIHEITTSTRVIQKVMQIRQHHGKKEFILK